MEKKVFFKNSKGDRLCGILSNPKESKEKPLFILCHGFATSKESYSIIKLEQVLNQNNISTFRFDFFGHGESEGNFEDITISEAVDDISNAIRLLKNLGYSKIGIVGSSFGGMAALLVASKIDDLFVLALKSPVSDYLGKIIAQKSDYPIKKWKEQGFIYYIGGIGRKQRLNYSFFEDAEKI